jgi:hypothetical protein
MQDTIQLILESSERDRITNYSQNNTPLSSRFPPTQLSPEEIVDPQVRIDEQNPRRLFINQRPYIIENMEYYNTATGSGNSQIPPIDYSQLLQSFFSPILVRPSENQISNAIRIIKYGEIENPLNISCPISLENFNFEDEVSQIIHCNHIFNKDQLHHWFQSNVRCPVCRYDIRTNQRDLTQSVQNEQSLEQEEDEYEDLPPLVQMNETQQSLQNPFDQFYYHNTEYSQEIENLMQTTTENLTNLLINGNTGYQNINDPSNNIQSRFLFDSSNNALIFETLFFNPRFTRH